MCHLVLRKGLAEEQHSTWSWSLGRAEHRGQSGVDEFSTAMKYCMGWSMTIDEFEHGEFIGI